MDLTPRRIEQLRADGIDAKKIRSKTNEILKNLSDDGYTLHESEYLANVLKGKLGKMKQREPGTKISEII